MNKNLFKCCAVFVLFLSLYLPCMEAAGVGTTEIINRAWKYKIGEHPGAEKLDFDDADWEQVGLPHSFSIPYFRSPDFYVGYGWYRKNIFYQPAWKGKRIHLDFEGVFQVAEVFLNEKLIGEHEGGYTGFTFDITDYLHEGNNLLAVRVNNLWSATLAPRAGEHVFSGGIYRDVSIRTTDNVYVAWKGTCVTTPEVSKNSARVKVVTEIVNSSDQSVHTQVHSLVKDGAGKLVAQMATPVSVPAHGSVQVGQLSRVIKNPQLWSPETPTLYVLETIVGDEAAASKKCDGYITKFGIRWFEWTADKGFFLNGKHYYLEGVNVHQDHAGWGDAVTKAGIYRDIKMMKDAGFNFIRGSHYPHHPYFAEVCDQLGMLYLSENVFWGIGGFGPDGYWNCSAYPVEEADEFAFSQSLKTSLKEMIRINRNSPSILAWSMCNEAFFCQPELMPKVKKKLTELVELSHRLDSSRIAIIGGCQRGELDVLGDAAGYNGDGATIYINPGIPSMVTEYGSCIADRPGNYEPCWGNIADNGAKPVWRSGHAIWCGFDHGSIAGDMGKMGIVDFFRIPKRSWYWYRNYHKGIAPPQWPVEGVASELRLSADKEILQGTDGTDDALIMVTVLDTNGVPVSNSPVVTLSIISGPGEFPTGRSITFRKTEADDIRILDGQAAIEFRSYEGGQTVIEATSEGLKPAILKIVTKGSPVYTEGVTPLVKERPYRMHTVQKGKQEAIRIISDYRPTRTSSVQNNHLGAFANDNDKNTYWQSGVNDKAPWWWLDMENFYKISEVSLLLEDSKCSFEVEVSENGEEWIKISSGRSDDAQEGWCHLKCSTDVYAVYLRVLFSEPLGVGAIKIADIKVRGEVRGF